MDSLVKVQYGNLILLTFNAPWVPAPATQPPPLTNPVLAAGRQEGGVALCTEACLNGAALHFTPIPLDNS